MFQSIVFTFLSLAAAQEERGTTCGSPGSPAQISVAFRQNGAGLIPGEDITTRLTGRSKVPLEQGTTVTTMLMLGSQTLLQTTKNFCAGAAVAGTPCPLAAGGPGFKYMQNTTIPTNLPLGEFQVRFILKNPEGNQIGCTGIKVNGVERSTQ